MFTIIQQGEQDNTFYTLQVAGKDVEHFTSLEAAARGLESLKQDIEESSYNEQQRQRKSS
jgi:hypothetical protein